MLNFRSWLEETHQQPHSYAVVLYNFPNTIKEKITNYSKKNIPQKDLYEPEGGLETHSHITILYGLKNTDCQKVQEKLKKTKSFPVKIGKISKFDNKDAYDVLKLDISGEGLFALNKTLSKIPHHSSYNEYKPHCTLAYVKKGSCRDLISKNPFKDLTAIVDKVLFIDTNKKETIIKLQ
jgi:2'-5' RNA ligase